VSRNLPKNIYSRPRKRGLQYYTILEGKLIILAHDDLKAAERKLQEIRGLSAPEHTIASMVSRFLAYACEAKRPDGTARWSAKTLHDYSANLRRSVLPVFGHLLMTELFPTHIQQFLTRRAAEGCAVDGNRCISALGACFTWALGQKDCPIQSNPCRGARRNPEYPRTRNVTVEEFNRFLQLAKATGGSRYMLTLIEAMVAITGRRRAEILHLLTRDYSLAENTWFVRDSKNQHRKYEIPNSPLIVQVIAEAKALRSVHTNVVFCTKRGHPYTSWGAAGTWQKMMDKWLQAGGEHFTAHDLRALYVGQIMAKGGNPETHSNPATTARVYDRRRIRLVTTLG